MINPVIVLVHPFASETSTWKFPGQRPLFIGLLGVFPIPNQLKLKAPVPPLA